MADYIETPYGRTKRWTHNGDEAGVLAPDTSDKAKAARERAADRMLDQ